MEGGREHEVTEVSAGIPKTTLGGGGRGRKRKLKILGGRKVSTFKLRVLQPKKGR